AAGASTSRSRCRRRGGVQSRPARPARGSTGPPHRGKGPRLAMTRLLRTTLVAALMGAALAVGGLAALADPPPGGFAPDPPPHASRTHWAFDIVVTSGKISLERAKPVFYDKPVETPRVVGRYALELY